MLLYYWLTNPPKNRTRFITAKDPEVSIGPLVFSAGLVIERFSFDSRHDIAFRYASKRQLMLVSKHLLCVAVECYRKCCPWFRVRAVVVGRFPPPAVWNLPQRFTPSTTHSTLCRNSSWSIVLKPLMITVATGRFCSAKTELFCKEDDLGNEFAHWSIVLMPTIWANAASLVLICQLLFILSTYVYRFMLRK